MSYSSCMSKLIKSSVSSGCLALLLLSSGAKSSGNENEFVPSEDYLQCHEVLKNQNINLAQRIIFCHAPGNEIIRKVSAFKDCSDALNGRFKNRAGEVCLTEFDNLSLLNSETLQCLDSTLKAASPDFVRNVSASFLNDFINILPGDCNDFPDRRNGKIKLHSTYTFATGELFSGYEIGGLSGAAYNPITNTLSAVSDQRGLRKNLVFNFNLNMGIDSVKVMPESILVLRPRLDNDYFDVDMESIVLEKSGNYIVSAENSYGSDKSFIHYFSADGSLLNAVPMPQKFFRGIRVNKGFEGLAISPDGKKLFTANEAALLHDQIPGRRVVRILSLNKNGASFSPEAEYLYEMEDILDNGLVEILALSQDELLILERGYNSRLHKVTARLYKISLKNASNVIRNESIKDVVDELDQLLLDKELLLDFDDVTPYFPAGLRRLDNLEGMALGPVTPNGKQSLILVSDNNMSSTQVTQFVILEL